MQGFPVLGSLTPAQKDRRDRAVQSFAAVVDKDSELDPLCRPEGGGSHRAPLGHLIKAPRRRMRPAGNGGSTRRMTTARRNDAGKRSTARPISAEAVEFSPALERTGRTKDQVQQNRRNQSDSSYGTPLTNSGGGGVVMSTGGEDVMKISAERPLSVEAVECDIPWYIYGFPRELLYHWCQLCTSGPP